MAMNLTCLNQMDDLDNDGNDEVEGSSKAFETKGRSTKLTTKANLPCIIQEFYSSHF
jgi:hypothetical protein